MRCASCRGARRDRGPPPQRRVLPRLLRPRTSASRCERAIRRLRMLAPGDRVLVAVSGGKDSLALWDMLLDLGYDAAGLYLGLGIGEYSVGRATSTRGVRAERGRRAGRRSICERDYGYDIPTAGRRGSRSTCSVCGLSKRYVFNRAALEGGFDVVATGHNLDDEAATLLGNTLRWQTEYIARQSPALPGDGTAW